MKVSVVGIDGNALKEIELPSIFEAPLRPDVIKRAFWLINSHSLQPKGRDPTAGEKTSAETYNPPTGHGISRLPRVKGERHPRAGQAAGVASVVKGRLPHPPKSEKVIHLKINKKERALATISAIAYTANYSAVLARGHRVSNIALPIVVSDDVEAISKTSDLVSFLQRLQLNNELVRLYNGIKRNTGKSRLRGRAYRERVGPLIVVTNDRGIGKAASSIPGVDVVRADSVSVIHLAPGGVPGRLTLYTESSLDLLKERMRSKFEA